MKIYTPVCCVLLASLCFSVTARSSVPRQQIIERLKTLRNIVCNSSFSGHYRSYQDSCHSIINEAIARIDSDEADYTSSNLQSVETLIELAGQMRFYRRIGKVNILCNVYKQLVFTFKNGQEQSCLACNPKM
ncbi:hypothetical protein HNQ91_001277 [Filimonas zeae]|uniref:Uncharacterized protein n=1 Tax=Filimonas zeae TaxID=1737353 RepID=A0A917IT55_9BACT|nr:hypothetical protein [Filimonas zeae]MDR6338255.1 hypothetical protein [Filimonas zeae]GGH62503.1 hypothetical protein GCM10011379_12510 [Filimonas zeae]